MIETSDKVICLKGKKVVLRPFDIATDFDLFVKWINDPEVIRFLLRIMPAYRHHQLAWFESLPNWTDIVFTIETIPGNIIGMIGLDRINLVDGTAWTWQIIGDQQNRSQGYGTDSKILLLDYAFNTLRLEKVCAEAIASNKSSLRYNEKSGFREEGRLKNQIYREGRRHDLVLLGILKDEFPEILEQYKSTENSSELSESDYKHSI
jgi:RimJ/RimL family protein N-acetyltransferase